jgi:hypothetical protein
LCAVDENNEKLSKGFNQFKSEKDDGNQSEESSRATETKIVRTSSSASSFSSSNERVDALIREHCPHQVIPIKPVNLGFNLD